MLGTSASYPDRRRGPFPQPNKQVSRVGEIFAGAVAQLPTLACASNAPTSIHIDPQGR